jgi:ribulose-bisphosphate carboxylase small chain
MKLTQGAFSFLPDLTDAEIRAQVDHGLSKGWAWSVEFTDDPHPRNTYWEMWGPPMFDLKDGSGVVYEINQCRKLHGDQYIRAVAFDSTRGVESIQLAFIVNRPKHEPGFRLVRQEGPGRSVHYAIESYAVDAEPEGRRY